MTGPLQPCSRARGLRRSRPILVAAGAGLLALAATASRVEAQGQAGVPPFRRAPIALEAAQVLPPALRSGNGYAVDAKVESDGWSNVYRLETDWGRYRIEGTDALQARIAEIAALHGLEELKRSSVMADAVKGGAMAPVKGAAALVTSPVGTTTGAVKGVGRWASNIGRSAVSRDPHQEGVVSAVVSYDGAKRAFALEFGVDPWTDFEPVQKRLGEVARASVGAGLTTSVVMGAALDTAGAAGLAAQGLGLASDMNAMLADNPAAVIRAENKKKLEALGVSGYAADAFVRNFNYTPLQHTVLVDALERMGDCAGREIFVAHATAAPSSSIANFMTLRAQMMAAYVERSGPVDVVDVADFPWLRTRSGTVLGVLPVDHLFWTAELAAAERTVSTSIAAQFGGAEVSKELWLEGRADPDVRRVFESRGWRLVEDAGLTPRGRLAKEAASGG